MVPRLLGKTDEDAKKALEEVGLKGKPTEEFSDLYEEGKVFEAGEIKIWKCRNCGHIHVALKAPELCPVCDHPKAYFEIKAENY